MFLLPTIKIRETRPVSCGASGAVSVLADVSGAARLGGRVKDGAAGIGDGAGSLCGKLLGGAASGDVAVLFSGAGFADGGAAGDDGVTGLTGAVPGVAPAPCAFAGARVNGDVSRVADTARAQVRLTCARFLFQLVKRKLLNVQSS